MMCILGARSSNLRMNIKNCTEMTLYFSIVQKLQNYNLISTFFDVSRSRRC